MLPTVLPARGPAPIIDHMKETWNLAGSRFARDGTPTDVCFFLMIPVRSGRLGWGRCSARFHSQHDDLARVLGSRAGQGRDRWPPSSRHGRDPPRRAARRCSRQAPSAWTSRVAFPHSKHVSRTEISISPGNGNFGPETKAPKGPISIPLVLPETELPNKTPLNAGISAKSGNLRTWQTTWWAREDPNFEPSEVTVGSRASALRRYAQKRFPDRSSRHGVA